MKAKQRVMLSGVDLKLYQDFKIVCENKGLRLMHKAAELFNKAMNEFIASSLDPDEKYPEIGGGK